MIDDASSPLNGTFSGSLEVTGFTSLGSGNTGLKCKYLTGTSPAAEGGTVTIAHGLTSDKIVGISSIIRFSSGKGVLNSYLTAAEYHFDVDYDSTNININLSGTSSGNLLSKPIAVLVWYIA